MIFYKKYFNIWTTLKQLLPTKIKYFNLSGKFCRKQYIQAGVSIFAKEHLKTEEIQVECQEKVCECAGVKCSDLNLAIHYQKVRHLYILILI